eukprot:scaffold3662_cov388-Prasinococcus_capsulatus_cf.AAC.8
MPCRVRAAHSQGLGVMGPKHLQLQSDGADQPRVDHRDDAQLPIGTSLTRVSSSLGLPQLQTRCGRCATTVRLGCRDAGSFFAKRVEQTTATGSVGAASIQTGYRSLSVCPCEGSQKVTFPPSRNKHVHRRKLVHYCYAHIAFHRVATFAYD